MSAINGMFFAIDRLCLRSFLPRNQQIRVPDSRRRRFQRHELSALKLASHLLMTSFLFLALVMAAWVASVTFHVLHSVYPFSSALLHFLDRLELWLVYVDGSLICGTLLFGGLHYVSGVVRGYS